MGKQYQKGELSTVTLILGGGVFVIILLLLMMIVPAFNERANVKNVVKAISEKTFADEGRARTQLLSSLSYSSIHIPEKNITRLSIRPAAEGKYNFDLAWKKEVDIVADYKITFNFEAKTER